MGRDQGARGCSWPAGKCRPAASAVVGRRCRRDRHDRPRLLAIGAIAIGGGRPRAIGGAIGGSGRRPRGADPPPAADRGTDGRLSDAALRRPVPRSPRSPAGGGGRHGAHGGEGGPARAAGCCPRSTAALSGHRGASRGDPPPRLGRAGRGGRPRPRPPRRRHRGGPGARWIGYLSTVGVYANYGRRLGGEDDAATRPARSRQRLAAETAWTALAGSSTPLDLRIAGIYGPAAMPSRTRRGTEADRQAGQAQRHPFADIAATAWRRPEGGRASTRRRAGAARGRRRLAAGLMGVPPPPAIPFEDAELSPMARSFYGENKRVANRRIREELGVALAIRPIARASAPCGATGRGGEGFLVREKA